MEEKHYLTVIALGFVLGAVLIYLASELARDVSEMQIAQDRTAVSSAERSEFCGRAVYQSLVSDRWSATSHG
jgi:hypothetical protein